MADNPADAITDKLISDMRAGMDRIGAELVARMREMVNIPDGGTPSRPIHSKPGEPPRRELGTYRDSWSHVTESTPDGVRTEAGTPMERGIWLEKGTGRMAPRPHASKLAKEFGGVVVERVREVIGEGIKA